MNVYLKKRFALEQTDYNLITPLGTLLFNDLLFY